MFLVLFPKKGVACDIKDFTSISLLGVSSKVLANRFQQPRWCVTNIMLFLFFQGGAQVLVCVGETEGGRENLSFNPYQETTCEHFVIFIHPFLLFGITFCCVLMHSCYHNRQVHDLLTLYNEIDVPPERLLFKIPSTWQVSICQEICIF